MEEFLLGLTFSGVHDRGRDRRIYSALTLERCRFESCSLGFTKDSSTRTQLRNVVVRNCSANTCFVYSPILEDVVVENLRTTGTLFVWGALYKHVQLIGRIGDLKIHPAPSGEAAAKGIPPEFQRDMDSFYRGVDWALDISRAEFTHVVDIIGIPSRLIRRDKETQAVITRDSALRGAWRDNDLAWKWLPGLIDVFLDDERPELILAAPKKGKEFREIVQGIERLRSLGIAT